MHINTHTHRGKRKEQKKKKNTNGKRIMMREREREREANALAYSLLQRVKKMMLHLDKKWINSFGWDKSFCVEKKENGGNGLTLATIATKLRRPKNEKKNWNYVGKWFVNEAGVWIIIH